jgi:methionine sulfoxide reductase heme-binding subunit
MKRIPALNVAVFVACLVPLARLAWKGLHNGLGANPIEVITRSTGTWTLVFLLATLSISPARKVAGWPDLIRFRRMLGLYAFFYVCLHFLTYIWLDKFFDLRQVLKDVYKRPFITAGFTGFLLLIPLAVTSTRGMIRRLGGRRWQLLHRLIYASATAGVVHYVWLVKADVRVPIIYACVLGLLLAYRVPQWLKPRLAQRRSAAPARRHSVLSDSA